MIDVVPDLADVHDVQSHSFKVDDKGSYVIKAENDSAGKLDRLLDELGLAIDDVSRGLLGGKYQSFNLRDGGLNFLTAKGGDKIAENIREEMRLNIEIDKMFDLDISDEDMYKFEHFSDSRLVKEFTDANAGVKPEVAILKLQESVDNLRVSFKNFSSQMDYTSAIKDINDSLTKKESVKSQDLENRMNKINMGFKSGFDR